MCSFQEPFRSGFIFKVVKINELVFVLALKRHNLKPTMFTCPTDISQSNKGSPFLDGGWLKTDLLIISKLSKGAFRQNSLFMVMVTSKEVTTQTPKACFGTLNTSDTFNDKSRGSYFLQQSVCKFYSDLQGVHFLETQMLPTINHTFYSVLMIPSV